MEKIELKVPIDNIENILGSVTSPSIVLSELIKNSVDSNAKNIKIYINTAPINQIIISDDGDGFSLDDIKNLGIISESNKKIDGNLLRKDGSYLTGSKGLGMLSLFSITKKITIETEKNKERYKITWVKGESSFIYEKIDPTSISGTIISTSDIGDEYLTILTDENELNKLKHISIKNYIHSLLDEKAISFYINNIRCNQLDVSHITDLSNSFIAQIKFNYEAETNLLHFKYISNNSFINKDEI